MRPVELEMVAFGPYADTVRIDFERIREVGLFVVAGPTGAGKTSIFDALCFALYGTLSGNRSAHGQVRSDYAAPGAECEFTLVFEARGERFRVWRRPKQERAKQRGEGKVEIAAQASLEREVGEVWEPLESGVRDVNARCKQLVGLTSDQFQRVVLLPQGRFQDVLHASSDDRAKLLRTLFGSELYDRVSDRLAAQAKQLRQAQAKVATEREVLLRGAAHRLADATQGLGAAQDSSPLCAPESPSSLEEIGAAVMELRSGPLATLTEARRVAEQQERRRRDDLATAKAQADAIEERRRALELEAELERRREACEADALRAQTARAADPVVSAARGADDASDVLRSAETQAATAWAGARERVELAGHALGPAPDVAIADQRRRTLESDESRFEAFVTDLKEAKNLAEQVTQLDRGIEQLKKDQLASKEARETDEKLRSELSPERARLLELEQQLESRRHRAKAAGKLVDARRELDGKLVEHELATQAHAELLEERADGKTRELDLKARLESLAPRVADLDSRKRVLEDRRACSLRWQQFRELEAALEKAESTAKSARSAADENFHRFVAGTAPRMAEALSAGKPCMVCGSTDHPDPAHTQSEDEVATVAEVERAAAGATEAEGQLRSIRGRIAQLLDEDSELVTQAPADLDEDVQVAERRVEESLAAESAAAELRGTLDQAISRGQQIEQQIEQHSKALSQLVADQAGLKGALGEEHGSRALAELESTARQARVAVDASEGASIEGAKVQSRLDEIASRAQQAEQASSELVKQLATTEAEGVEKAKQARELRDGVVQAIGGASPTERVRRARRAIEALEHARELANARDLQVVMRDNAIVAVEAAVAGSPFDDRDSAFAAAMSGEDLGALERGVAQWQEERKGVAAVLASLAKQDLPEHAPDLEALEQARAQAGEHATSIRNRWQEIDGDLKEADRSLAAVAKMDAGSTKDRERAALVARVDEVVAGRRGRKVSLERWVLAAYLRDVVEHANVHLAVMSRGRYQLEVKEEAAHGGASAGLELQVHDAFSGVGRSPVSLSGGETFQASLSLALGLADVVTGQRAGLRLEALFVDEGFGSLDAASIDQAVAVLDGLQTRGAMVGVITHVEAMKDALPVAIEVTPRADRRGSELRQLL